MTHANGQQPAAGQQPPPPAQQGQQPPPNGQQAPPPVDYVAAGQAAAQAAAGQQPPAAPSPGGTNMPTSETPEQMQARILREAQADTDRRVQQAVATRDAHWRSVYGQQQPPPAGYQYGTISGNPYAPPGYQQSPPQPPVTDPAHQLHQMPPAPAYQQPPVPAPYFPPPQPQWAGPPPVDASAVRDARSSYRDAVQSTDFQFVGDSERNVAAAMAEQLIAQGLAAPGADSDRVGRDVAQAVRDTMKGLRQTIQTGVLAGLRSSGSLIETAGAPGVRSAGTGAPGAYTGSAAGGAAGDMSSGAAAGRQLQGGRRRQQQPAGQQ